ncbi:MAG TPA: MFS transporter [Thermomicrobiales bacterium]|nr:MFS transporter [Thermomicrobiales bacterium]
MTVAYGLSQSLQGSIVTNYFEDDLGLRGSQFGYITAIREIPGFLLIFITALFYRLSLQRMTALALVLVAIGYSLFPAANSFWSVAPWVILSSIGYHTVLQTQAALGMSLTVEASSGKILGTLAAIQNIGSVLALTLAIVAFHYDWLSFHGAYYVAGACALIAAVAIFGFPHLQDGEVREFAAKREPVVLRRAYRYYYALNILDGARQQILFSFGLWVLVDRFGLKVPQISALLLVVTVLTILTSRRIGHLIDVHGERRMLSLVNIGYVVALGGYAIANTVWLASVCYVIYFFIFPLSAIGAATYLRKVAVSDEIAPSLAMGVTLQHLSAIVVPATTGLILNYVGYQIPFLIAAGFACLTFGVTRRLDPATQKSPARLAQEEQAAVLAGAR